MKNAFACLRYIFNYVPPELPEYPKAQISWEGFSEEITPHLEDESHQILSAFLKKTSVFLEYGAGGSTLLALNSGVSEVHSVESDYVFLSSISRKVDSLDFTSRFHPHPIDIGPTGEWGIPLSRDFSATWMLYPLMAWWKLIISRSSPELILIDGRFRVSCFLASYWFARKGTIILFDDYYDRPCYHIVELCIKPSKRVGRMAIFEKDSTSGMSSIIYMLLHLSDFR